MRRKSPQLKKEDEYAKDHRVYAEYPKAFRKHWPLKKATDRRKYRHRAMQLLQRVKVETDLDLLGSECKAVTPRGALRKGGVCCLRAWIDGHREHRESLAGRKAKRTRIAFVSEAGRKQLRGYNMLVEWSSKDQVFVVSLPEFGSHAKIRGSTFNQAVRRGREAMQSLIEAYQTDGRPLPKDLLSWHARRRSDTQAAQKER